MDKTFNIHDELIKVNSGTVELVNELDISTMSLDEMNDKLDEFVEILTNDPANLADVVIFDGLRSFIKCFDVLRGKLKTKVLITILSGLRLQLSAIIEMVESDYQFEDVIDMRRILSLYMFLLQWTIGVAESQESSLNPTTTVVTTTKKKTSTGKKGKGGKAVDEDNEQDDTFDWVDQKKAVLLIMKETLSSLNLNKLFEIKHERETFISLFTKPAYTLLSHPDVLRDDLIKSDLFDILAICIKHHDQSIPACTAILQNLRYFEHLAEPLADFLSLLADKYDHFQVIDNVLLDLSRIKFSLDNHNVTWSKSCALFLVRLTEKQSKSVSRKISLLVRHLESDSYILRCGVVEVLGHIISNSSNTDNTASSSSNSNIASTNDRISNYFDMLQERLRDCNSFVRAKVLQTIGYLIELKAVPLRRKSDLLDSVIDRIKDKSAHVRRKAIQVVTTFLRTHPFSKDGGELKLSFFQERVLLLEQQIASILHHEGNSIIRDSSITSRDDQSATDLDQSSTNGEASSIDLKQSANDLISSRDKDPSSIDREKDRDLSSPTTTNKINQSSITPMMIIEMKYYKDAMGFVMQIHKAIELLIHLLSSKIRTDVMETIAFFVTAHHYQIDNASKGFHQMLPLLWRRDSGGEATKTIKEVVIIAYKDVYFSASPDKSTRNLIQLILDDHHLNDLVSLDEIIYGLTKLSIFDEVIKRLWLIYSGDGELPFRRAAIIGLSMMARAMPSILHQHVNTMIKTLATLNDGIICQYTCIAMQQLQTIEGLIDDHPILVSLSHCILDNQAQSDWYRLAEQAVNTIYLLAQYPDVFMGNLLCVFLRRIFMNKENINDLGDMNMSNIGRLTNKMTNMSNMDNGIDNTTSSSTMLARLVFVVGHTAIKQMVHLEKIEKTWKVQKRAAEAVSANAVNTANDVGQVAGSVEDEFSEGIQFVREKELLYGPTSMLALFAPLIIQICNSNSNKSNPLLLTSATLALAKLMCVSSAFCESQLPLLMTLLVKSEIINVRSNIVIALGDLTVCFNHLIDQNISYLYDRLKDENTSIRKNAFMVLTHLILHGMVKVKGQISEMAKCLIDQEERMRELAQIFFSELSSKDNSIYNLLPDIISHLGVTEEGSFRGIMSVLLKYIKKEKQGENLIDKLCGRFRMTDQSRQWRDISFCLSNLPFTSDKSIKKLLDHFPSYQDKLTDDGVFESFQLILHKVKKFIKVEMKASVEELEKKITMSRQSSDTIKEEVSLPMISEEMEKMTLTTECHPMAFSESEEGEGDEDDEEETLKKSILKTPNSSLRVGGKKMITSDSDESESEEDEEEEMVVAVKSDLGRLERKRRGKVI